MYVSTTSDLQMICIDGSDKVLSKPNEVTPDQVVIQIYPDVRLQYTSIDPQLYLDELNFLGDVSRRGTDWVAGSSSTSTAGG
jgi:hypothetical protein